MTTYLLVAILAAAVLGLGLRKLLTTFASFRGMRVLTCPQTRQPTAVDLKAWHAALTSLFGRRAVQVQDCSNWPGWGSCDQLCVREIETAPEAHRVPEMLVEWCRSQPCVCCGAPIGKVHVRLHQPHLMGPELKILEWSDVPPQNLPQTLKACGPVCETCAVAETHTW